LLGTHLREPFLPCCLCTCTFHSFAHVV
jgi:hypothetical protein